MIAGVSDNRVQNVVITLDKVKLTLSRQGQCQRSPLRLLDSDEVTEYLWTGDLIGPSLQLLDIDCNFPRNHTIDPQDQQ